MATVVLGIECKAYYLTIGSTRASWGTVDANGNHVGAAPGGLTEAKVARNVTVTLGSAEADVSSRASFFKLARKALRELSIELELPWKPTDAAFTTLLAAYNLQGSSVAMAFLDGDKATTNSQGPWADWEVMEFNREEDITNAAIAKVKLIPTDSAVAPEWVKVA